MADMVLQNGTIYDGSGSPPYQGDVAIQGDQIAALGAPGTLDGTTKIDVSGLAVAPGFINMLSWSVETLIEDGRSQSEIRQGVTLEVMGEGTSMGPLSRDEMRESAQARHPRQRRSFNTKSSGRRSASTSNIWSGAAFRPTSPRSSAPSTLRVHEIGYDDRPPTDDELARMCELVRQAMREGAMGMSAALIYPPASYAKTEELIALAKAVAEFDGMYISHLRSEGPFFVEAADELITHRPRSQHPRRNLSPEGSGARQLAKMDEVIRHVEAARAEGLHDHRRYVYVPGRRHRPERLHPALGARRRRRSAAGPPERPGHARPHHRTR